MKLTVIDYNYKGCCNSLYNNFIDCVCVSLESLLKNNIFNNWYCPNITVACKKSVSCS